MTVGLFRNRVIDVWAAAALLFLLAAIYIPWVQDRLKFSAISAAQLLVIAAVAIAITSLAEVVKLRR